jgi:hypothetical protein
MKLTRSFQFLILAAISLALLAGTPAYSKATFTPIEGVAYMMGLPTGGTVKCIGGEPTGFWPPCTPGSKAQLRNVVVEFEQYVPAYPALNGPRTCILNANFDASGKGHAWGTWRAEHADGSISEGVFTNSITGWFAPAVGKALGRVTEGPLDGLHVFLTLTYDYFPVNPKDPQSSPEKMDGYLLDPKGGK